MDTTRPRQSRSSRHASPRRGDAVAAAARNVVEPLERRLLMAAYDAAGAYYAFEDTAQDSPMSWWSSQSTQTGHPDGEMPDNTYLGDLTSSVSLTLQDLPEHERIFVSASVIVLDNEAENPDDPPPGRMTLSVSNSSSSGIDVALTDAGIPTSLDINHDVTLDEYGCETTIIDSIYGMGDSFDHIDATATVEFNVSGLASGAKWGLDNVTVGIVAPQLGCDCDCGDPSEGTTDTPVPGPTSGGFGGPIGPDIDIGNGDVNSFGGAAGNGTVDASLPFLLRNGPSTVIVASGSVMNQWFDQGSGGYSARYGFRNTLAYDSATDEYTLASTDGTVSRFYGFASAPEAQRGKVKSTTHAGGNVVTYGYDSTTSLLTEVTRSSPVGSDTVKESFSYTYVPSGEPNAGKYSAVTLRRKTYVTSDGENSASYVAVRAAAYSYYDGVTGAGIGTAGDLRTVAMLDPAAEKAVTSLTHSYDTASNTTTATAASAGHGYQVGDTVVVTGASPGAYNGTFIVTAVAGDGSTFSYKVAGNPGSPSGTSIKANKPLDVTHYRYHTSNTTTGYTGALKYVLGPQAYARLSGASPDPLSPSTDVSAYADEYYEYDARRRVTLKRVAGEGCSACSGGQGDYTYAYADSLNGSGYNMWARKTTETLPDNNQNITYYNVYSQPILHIFKEAGTNGRQWLTFTKYDDQGRVLWTANPSAVSGYDETKSDLLNFSDRTSDGVDNPDYEHLRDGAGLIDVTSYYASDTASDTSAGGFAGYVHETFVQQGEAGTPVKQRTLSYFKKTAGGATVAPLAAETVYRNADGTGEQTTSYEYTYISATAQVETRTTKRPIATEAQNGPGGTEADEETETFDAFSRMIRTVDGDGYARTYAYDLATGGMTQEVVDAGGMNLTTTYAVDALGRTTRETDPNGNVIYTVHNDARYEVRTYRGWDVNAGTATGLVEVSREVRPAANSQKPLFTEMLTSSEAPARSGSAGSYAPTGGEEIRGDDVQSLTRSYTSAAGQVVTVDEYFSMVNLLGHTETQLRDPYLGSSSIDTGVAGGNYHRTSYDYDKRGRTSRVASPTGTITRTIYDGLGRAASTWVGTDDTPDTGFWPESTAGTNMTKVSENEYDNNNVGDGNLTKTTAYPGGTAPARVTGMYYDWRSRRVATKHGDDGTDDAQRQLLYCDLDNLGNQIACWTYDADGVTITSSGGVPQKPSAALLRGKTTTEFDEQGRPFRTSVFSVDNSGNVSANSLKTETWYDRRGNVIKTVSPNSPVTKTQFDAAGRAYKSFVSDGGGDVASGQAGNWAYADDVVGDVVLTQTLSEFDKNGNVIKSTTRDRFHNGVGTGELSNQNGGSGPSATYVTTDTATQGSWRDGLGTDYGSDGYHVIATTAAYPAYATVTPSGHLEYVWNASTTDVRALQKPAPDTDRIAATWYSSTSFSVEVSITDGKAHQVALYLLDWDSLLRSQLVDVTASSGDTVLDSRTISDFSNGKYLVYNISDTVTFTFTNPLGPLSNAVLSGIFFDPGPNTAPSAARVSYQTGYYDNANRMTASVDVGTNGGSAYARPTSVPTASDTVLVTGYTYKDDERYVAVTDPRGNASRTYRDMLGRTTKTVEAYTDGAPSASDDRTTLYTYDGVGHVLKMTADMPDGSADQTTQYEYDTGLVTGSDIISTDLLTRVSYPDKATGAPGAADGDRQLYTYNALGEVTSFRDQNLSTHTYARDVLGRMLSDEVTTLGAGVDGAVRKLSTSYDTAGRPEKLTSHDATGGIVNQVQRQYNGLGQLTAEFQSAAGAVDLLATPKVQYAYSEMANSANHSRLTRTTYPNGRAVATVYAGGTDDKASRPTYLWDGGSASCCAVYLEQSRYLGWDTVVERYRQQPGSKLTYIKQYGESDGADGGDKYRGLDRFGRVTEQRWQKDSGGVQTDRFGYGYDRNGSPLYEENLVSSAHSELYHADGASANTSYDKLNRLTEFQRGTLNAAKDTIASETRGQQFNLDPLGNWGDTSGSGVTGVTNDGTPQYRAHNKRNQLTAVMGTSLAAPDNNGNMKGDELGHAFAYDAWNRAVNAAGVTWGYDALGRKVTEGATTLFYSAQWQVLEERQGSATKAQYVWSNVYVDALVLRDRDADGSSTSGTSFNATNSTFTSGLEQRHYVQHDANYNVTSLTDAAGAVVQRLVYDVYGAATLLDVSWGLSSDLYDQRYRHQGGRYDAGSNVLEFRHRIYSPTLGRWMQEDPAGHVDGANLYQYVSSSPSASVDPLGLAQIREVPTYYDFEPHRYPVSNFDHRPRYPRGPAGPATPGPGAAPAAPAPTTGSKKSKLSVWDRGLIRADFDYTLNYSCNAGQASFNGVTMDGFNVINHPDIFGLGTITPLGAAVALAYTHNGSVRSIRSSSSQCPKGEQGSIVKVTVEFTWTQNVAGGVTIPLGVFRVPLGKSYTTTHAVVQKQFEIVCCCPAGGTATPVLKEGAPVVKTGSFAKEYKWDP